MCPKHSRRRDSPVPPGSAFSFAGCQMARWIWPSCDAFSRISAQDPHALMTLRPLLNPSRSSYRLTLPVSHLISETGSDMKTIILDKPGQFQLSETEAPAAPLPGQALVRVRR